MRYFILASLLFPFAGFAQNAKCPQRIGATVFFDFNNSRNEVSAARAHAANSCQRFLEVRSYGDSHRVLAELEKSGEKPISMVLSGHSGSLGFTGSFFKMNRDDFKSMINSYPSVKANTKNLYLWGCYSNNISKLLHWLGSFDSLSRVYGFEHKSPLDAQLLGAEYLGKAMAHDNTLSNTRSLAQIKNLLDNRVVPGQTGGHLVLAAIWGKVECLEDKPEGAFYYQVTDHQNAKIRDATDFQKDCGPEIQNFMKNYQETLQAHWIGYKPILPLDHPEAKIPEKHPVRMLIYPWANKYAHCFNGQLEINTRQKISVGQVLNLIFFHQIKKNFFTFFKKDFENVKAVLKNLKGDDADRARWLLENAPDITRTQANELPWVFERLANSSSWSDRPVLAKFAKMTDMYLAKMDERCADIEWIDDRQTFHTPAAVCVNP